MAKKKDGGESKTGLILSLVGFVLTTIIFGVMTYVGFSGQAELAEAARTQKKAADDMKKERESVLSRLLVLRIALGINAKEDQETLTANLGQDANKKAVEEETAALSKTFKDYGVEWDGTTNRAKKTALAAIEDAATAQKKAEQELATEKANAKTAKEEADDRVAKAEAGVEKFKGEMKKLEQSVLKIQQEKSEAFVASQLKIDQLGKEVEGQKKDRAEYESQVKKDRGKDKERIDDLVIARQKAEAQIPKKDILDYERPKGSVVNVDRRTQEVDIDLGWADNVRPQLTFSVLPREAVGKGAAARQRKAAIEVIRVVGPHLSVAKFTEPPNAARDPVMRGDLLYNPAWSPNLREHVAIAGIIDLNGDGSDDTAEFIRALERQGVVVDSYLDLRDLTFKGPGVSDKTQYLILGDTPNLEATGTGGLTGNKRDVRLQDVITKMTEVQNRAKETGTQVIQARRFMALIGFEVPRTTVAPDYAASKYLRPQRSEAAPAAPTGEQPPAEEKKEDAGK